MFDVLQGIRVLDWSQNLAGPFCGQILADFGADVTKVEPPGGDPARNWGPPFIGDDGALFLATNRGKRRVTVDLKTDHGRTRMWELLAQSDVVVEAFRTGVTERLGFPHEEVRARFPGLIYLSLSAYGREGPGADLAGYDPLLQAFTGLVANTGTPDGPPARVGASVIDLGTGMWAALGILAALRHRDATGEGSTVEVSLLDTGLAWMSYHLTGYLASGTPPQRMGTSLALIAPYGAFPTADGELMIAAPNNRLFGKLCDALGLESLTADPRFAENPDRVGNREALRAALSGVTRAFPRSELSDRLRAAGVPAAPIQSVPEVVDAPEVKASGMLRAAPHEGRADYWDVAPPLKWNGQRAPLRSPPPGRDEPT